MADSEFLAHIGTTLRRQREAQGLTQAELAGRVSTSQATVARIERGDRAPSVAMLERLFAVLGHRVRLALEPLAGDDPGAALLDRYRQRHQPR